LAAITNNLTSLLVLALIVAVHELGHFIGARSQGIKVRNFSIGFGPTLLSFKEGPEEDDIEYTLRAIPMGGFISFPPHYEQDADGELIRYEGFYLACVRGFIHLLLLLLGPRSPSLRLLSKKHFLNQSSPLPPFIRQPRCIFSPNPPFVFSLPYRYEDKDLLQNRPPLQQAIVISAGVIANLFLSFGLLLGSVATTGLPRPQFSDGPYVMRVVEKDCPAARAGIQPEDLILAVNGQKVTGDEKGLNGAVSLISQSAGEPVELRLRRRGEEITKMVTPRINPDTGRSSIGTL